MSQSSLGIVLLGSAAAAGVAIGLILGRTVLKPRLPKGTVKHVFLAKFKPDTPVEQVQSFIDAYRVLHQKIGVMHGFEW